MKRILAYFLQGLLYIAPLSITIYIIVVIVGFVNRLISEHISNLIPFLAPWISTLLILISIILTGFIGQTIIARPIKVLLKKTLEKAPIINLIYSSIRDLLSAFVGKEKKFSQPVLVRVNTISNLEKLGFITKEDLSKIGIDGDKVAVYFPHSYNFSGELFIVPSENITKIDRPSAEIMKFIVSGGVASE